MRKTVLYIAMSLDGYIADRNGKVDWLMGQDAHMENDDGYEAFVREMDTIIMGWETYHQVVTELSPEEWVYNDLQSYVITHRKCQSTANITFTSTEPCALVEELGKREGKDIWICGGASIVRQLMEKDQIDRYHISVIPTILGGGIRLFGCLEQERRLRLITARSSNGIAELVYEKRLPH